MEGCFIFAAQMHNPIGKTTGAQQPPAFYFRPISKGKISSFTPAYLPQDIFRLLASISQFCSHRSLRVTKH